MNTLDRFSNRVDNYIKYRPDYPVEILTFLKQKGFLNRESVISDIGSGTGISAELFLKEGNAVFGVEPNKEMREAGERLLSDYKNLIYIEGASDPVGPRLDPPCPQDTPLSKLCMRIESAGAVPIGLKRMTQLQKRNSIHPRSQALSK